MKRAERSGFAVFHAEHAGPGPAGPCDVTLSPDASDDTTRGQDPSSESARNLLQRGLVELRYTPTPPQTEALLTLASELERWSQRMNLTAHRSPEAIVRHLILGAAAIAAQIPPITSLVDIGSGAGFPGLPFAVLRPEARVTLVEPRRKRHHFQRAAIRAMGIVNVEIQHGRAEDLEPTHHEAAVAQALAQPDQAVRWMAPWVATGGLLLLAIAADAPPPSETPEIFFNNSYLRYQVPCGGPARALWIGRRS